MTEPIVDVLLGPAPCQGCRKLVVYGPLYWADRLSPGELKRWRDPDTGRQHRCEEKR